MKKKLILKKQNLYQKNWLYKFNDKFEENEDEKKFITINQLFIENHIEFAKIFQIGSNKIKNVKQINFNLEKEYGQTDFIIKNIKINDGERILNSKDIFLVKNIQNLRAYIRELIN